MSSSTMYPVCTIHHGSITTESTGRDGSSSFTGRRRKNFYNATTPPRAICGHTCVTQINCAMLSYRLVRRQFRYHAMKYSLCKICLLILLTIHFA